MKTSEYIFKDLEDAITRLEKFGNTFRFPRFSSYKYDIIKNCVSSNTFRAFQLSENKPSDLFRSWASCDFDNILKRLNNIKTQDDYDKFISIKTDSFINFWSENVLEPSEFIIYGHAVKMINLLIKHIQESMHFSIKNIYRYQHVPLDSHSLKPLTNIINELTDLNYKISIPSNVSMKFINCPQIYWIVLNSVRKLSKKAKILPITYDYWSWNDKH